MTYVIAEAGVNHNGSLRLALDLIDAAADAGADAAKFQAYDPESFPPAKRHILRPLSFGVEAFLALHQRCMERGIEFLVTPFDIASARFFAERKLLKRVKISSASVRDIELMRFIGTMGLPVIMSCGMATPAQIVSALEVLPADTTLLSCVSVYPTPDARISLRDMDTLRRLYNRPVGWSDHTRTIGWCVAAAAVGAVVVEKHVTLSREMPGPDQACSCEPDELNVMVREIRAVKRV